MIIASLAAAGVLLGGCGSSDAPAGAGSVETGVAGIAHVPAHPGWSPAASESTAEGGTIHWFELAEPPERAEVAYRELLREQEWVIAGETQSGARRVLSLVRGRIDAQRITVFIEPAGGGSRIGIAAVTDYR